MIMRFDRFFSRKLQSLLLQSNYAMLFLYYLTIGVLDGPIRPRSMYKSITIGHQLERIFGRKGQAVRHIDLDAFRHRS